MRLIDADVLKQKTEQIIGINGSSDAWRILSEIDHAETIDSVWLSICQDDGFEPDIRVFTNEEAAKKDVEYIKDEYHLVFMRKCEIEHTR